MEDVHQLRIFRAVAQRLSFTRAAEALYLTQSAVSHAIAALEHDLGVMLFERQGRTVRLTEAGRVLAEQAGRVFAALDEAEHRVKQAARPELGKLRIGVSPAACQYLLPESIREFRECYPAYSLAIEVADSPRMAELLDTSAIDLAVMIRAERSQRMTFHELFRDELGMIVSPLHPLAKAGKMDRTSLRNQHFILYAKTSTTFHLVERHLSKLGAPLQNYLELGSMEAIKEIVKLGMGVSIVAKWIARQELRDGSLIWIPLPGQKLTRAWSLAHSAGRRLTIAEQTLYGLLKQVGLSLVTEE